MCDLALALACQTLTGWRGGSCRAPAGPQLQLHSGPARCGLDCADLESVRHNMGSDGTDSVSPLSLSLSLSLSLRPPCVSAVNNKGIPFVCLLSDHDSDHQGDPPSLAESVPLTIPVLSRHLMHKLSSKRDSRTEGLHYNALSGGQRGETNRAVFGQKAGLYLV